MTNRRFLVTNISNRPLYLPCRRGTLKPGESFILVGRPNIFLEQEQLEGKLEIKLLKEPIPVSKKCCGGKK